MNWNITFLSTLNFLLKTIRLRANRRNIGVQQLPALLDVTCCVRLHTLLHVVAQSLKPVKLFSQQFPTFLLFRDRRSVAQQCWIRLHSSSNIVGATHAHYAWFTKTYGLYPSHDALQVPTLLGVVASVCTQLCTPLPTRTIKKISQLKNDIRSCRCTNFSLKQASGLIGGIRTPRTLPLHRPMIYPGDLYLHHEMQVINEHRTAKDCIGNNKFNNYTSKSFVVLAYCLLILRHRKLGGFLTSNSNHELCFNKAGLTIPQELRTLFLDWEESTDV